MTGAGALDVLRPFAWLALIALLAGLLSYLLLAAPAPVGARTEAPASTVSGPASDDWNLPKDI